MAFAARILATVACATVGSRAQVHERVYLFVDPDVVHSTSSSNWSTVVPPAEKEPRSPLMEEREIWEVRWDNTYPTTRWDAAMGKFRMWYGSCVSCNAMPKPADSHVNPRPGCGHPTWHQQHPDQVGTLIFPLNPNPVHSIACVCVQASV